MKSKFKSQLFFGIIIFSAIGLFIAPKEHLMEQLKTNIPWVALGILISEILLTAGFLMMLSIAAPAFFHILTKNIKNFIEGLFNLKEIISEFDWKHVAKKCNKSKFFWVGYWMSVIGALGDGIVLIIGIGRSLPAASWGLMILPFWDLWLTYIIRKSILKGVRKHGEA